MNILVITPAEAGSRAGNRATALRYRKFLLEAGHACRLEQDFDACPMPEEWPVNCAIVLHAIRGRYAIAESKRRGIPLVLVLTGTDYYRFQFTQAAEFEASLEAADVLVCLHDLGYRSVPEKFHNKLVVIKQSVAFEDEALPPAGRGDGESPLNQLLASSLFPVAVIGHLREEKDPFVTARAAHLMPAESGIQVLHAGSAHSKEWASKAREEMTRNIRYHWLGELTRRSTKVLLAQTRLMVISSIMEGGANIVSEACTLGCPVLASDIDGNKGLLGSDYPGLFKVGDEHALKDLLHRCETDPAYLAKLREICEELADDFTPALESAGLLESIARARSASK